MPSTFQNRATASLASFPTLSCRLAWERAWAPHYLDALVRRLANRDIQLNTLLIGLLVLVVACLERVRLRRWQEVAEIILGAWLLALPFIRGYAGAGGLRYWHFALGGIVILLALHEL